MPQWLGALRCGSLGCRSDCRNCRRVACAPCRRSAACFVRCRCLQPAAACGNPLQVSIMSASTSAHPACSPHSRPNCPPAALCPAGAGPKWRLPPLCSSGEGQCCAALHRDGIPPFQRVCVRFVHRVGHHTSAHMPASLPREAAAAVQHAVLRHSRLHDASVSTPRTSRLSVPGAGSLLPCASVHCCSLFAAVRQGTPQAAQRDHRRIR